MSQTVLLDVTEANFAEEVLDSTLLTLALVVPPGGSPKMEHLLEEIAEENNGKVKCVRLRSLPGSGLVQSLDLKRLPSFILFSDGEPVERVIGPTTRQLLQVVVNSHA